MYLRREYTSILSSIEDYQGIVFTPQLHSDENWTGIIFIRSDKSPWYKGAFTFHVHFPPRYPFECPTAAFELPLNSHPLLQATEGRIIPFDAEYLSLDPMHVSVMARLLKFIRRLFLPQEWCFLHTEEDTTHMLGRPNVDLRLLQKDMELRTVSQEVLLRKPYVEYLTMEAKDWIVQHVPTRVKYEEEESATAQADEREVEASFTSWLLRTFIPYAKNLI